jgi:hypothetical protein
LSVFKDLPVTAFVSPYDAWAATHWPSTSFARPSLADPLLDPDQDGFSNLAEFALNSPPNSGNPDPVSFEEVESDGLGYLQISIPRNPNATGITFQLEAKDRLDSEAPWSPVEAVVDQSVPTIIRLRDTVPIDGNNARFLRVKIVGP